MLRSRTSKVAAVLAATLSMAALVVVSSWSHEADVLDDDAPPAGSGPQPDRTVAMPAGLIGLEIALGLKDTAATEWEGDISVSEGRVVEVMVERSGPASQVEGSHFAVGTAQAKKAANVNKKKAAAAAKDPTAKKQVAAAKKKAAAAAKKAAAVGPVLSVILDAPERATVTVTMARGTFTFSPADLAPGRRTTFLEGQAAVERQDAAIRLTGRDTEDDFPVSATAPDGSIWMAYVEYRPDEPRPLGTVQPQDFDTMLTPKAADHGDRIRLRRFDGKAWQPALDVTPGNRDVWRPAVAVDGRGVVWVAWAEPIEGDWEIFRRTYTPPRPNEAGAWSEPVRVTEAPGSDYHVVAATDARGVVWLAWQSWRGNNYDILAAAQQEGHPWNKPRAVSDCPANDWSPAIAADPKGNVFVAWDTYDRGNYDVKLCRIGTDLKTWTVADSPRFEARPHLAADRDGRVWVAYEQGDEQWGKDYAHAGEVRNVGLAKNPGFALYVNRMLRVKCLADDTLMQPAGPLERAFQGQPERNKSVPRLAVDGAGGLWLLYRRHLEGGGEAWHGFATRYDGKAWSPARQLASSSNLIDNRPALAASGAGLLAVYSSDHRNNTQGRGQDDLFAAFLTDAGTPSREPELIADTPSPAPTVDTVHPAEPEDIARIRAYRVEAGGKSLRLLRGEFHRHTEFTSHTDQDGLFEDAWRYALDAADHDWMGDGDHDNGFGHEYMWWLIQKVTDLHHHAPRFVAAMTYERSVVYPNGHRNVMMPRRGIRPLPRGGLPGTAEDGSPDTKLLYDYLKHFGGICASHTSATDMGTDWRDNDPEVEPIVEIYQGHRHNYEAPGAPRAPTAETQIGGFQPAGFVWNALEKGYRFGFQSSSDHVSTHLSYAIALAEEPTRRGIIDAFRQRHCYAATDNIILDVRSGDRLMGDSFETKDRPSFEVIAHGTDTIARVHVVRDNKYVLSTEPNARQVKLRYTDDDAKPGESHYYYVRIEQADKGLAWGSPMWITYKE